jgi:hypothetical protein
VLGVGVVMAGTQVATVAVLLAMLELITKLLEELFTTLLKLEDLLELRLLAAIIEEERELELTKLLLLPNALELTLLLLNKDELLLDIVAADWLIEDVTTLELDDLLLATDELIPTAELLLARLVLLNERLEREVSTEAALKLLEVKLAMLLLKGIEEGALKTTGN